MDNASRRRLLQAGLALSLPLAALPRARAQAGSGDLARVVLGATVNPPYWDIVELIKPRARDYGLDLVVKPFTDTRQINVLLGKGDLDANFNQHVPYLNQFNRDNKTNLVQAAGVFIGVFGAYSKRYRRVADVPDGALLVYPNDPSNSGRALDMFARHGLIKLKEGAGIQATRADIIDNPRKFRFREVEQPMLVRTLDDADLVAINASYVLAIGINPVKDALLLEGDSVFVSSIVTRPEINDSVGIRRLARAVTSPEVRDLLTRRFGDSVRVAF